ADFARRFVWEIPAPQTAGIERGCYWLQGLASACRTLVTGWRPTCSGRFRANGATPPCHWARIQDDWQQFGARPGEGGVHGGNSQVLPSTAAHLVRPRRRACAHLEKLQGSACSKE